MLAVEEWLTPKGHTIWHKGITPDAAVDLPPGIYPLFPDAEKALTAKETLELFRQVIPKEKKYCLIKSLEISITVM